MSLWGQRPEGYLRPAGSRVHESLEEPGMSHKTSFFAAFAIAVGALAASLTGCELISSVDRTKIAGTGGAGGAGAMGAMCTDPRTDCPIPSTVCFTATCGTDATCTTENAAA